MTDENKKEPIAREAKKGVEKAPAELPEAQVESTPPTSEGLEVEITNLERGADRVVKAEIKNIEAVGFGSSKNTGLAKKQIAEVRDDEARFKERVETMRPDNASNSGTAGKERPLLTDKEYTQEAIEKRAFLEESPGQIEANDPNGSEFSETMRAVWRRERRKILERSIPFSPEVQQFVDRDLPALLSDYYSGLDIQLDPELIPKVVKARTEGYPEGEKGCGGFQSDLAPDIVMVFDQPYLLQEHRTLQETSTAIHEAYHGTTPLQFGWKPHPSRPGGEMLYVQRSGLRFKNEAGDNVGDALEEAGAKLMETRFNDLLGERFPEEFSGYQQLIDTAQKELPDVPRECLRVTRKQDPRTGEYTEQRTAWGSYSNNVKLFRFLESAIDKASGQQNRFLSLVERARLGRKEELDYLIEEIDKVFGDGAHELVLRTRENSATQTLAEMKSRLRN